MRVDRKLARFGILILILALVLSVVTGIYFRFFLFVEQHGGGMPHILADGRTVLNNHGNMTEVSTEIYRESVRRWHTAVAVGISSFGVFVIVLVLYLYRSSMFRLRETAK